MKFMHLPKRISKAALLIAVGLTGGGAAIAVASVPDSNGTYHACVEMQTITSSTNTSQTITEPVPFSGNVAIIDPSAGEDCNSLESDGPEQAISWNQLGPQGATGPQGQTGPQGPAGAQGATGASGQTITLKSSATPTTASETPVAEVVLTPGNASLPKGETQDLLSSSHLKFEAVNLSYIAQRTSTIGSATGGAGTGKVSATTIEISKVLDKQSVSLLGAVDLGQVFTTGEILIPLPNHTDEYLELTLHNAFITADHVQSNGPKNPLEDLTLEALAVKITDVTRGQLGNKAPPTTITAPGWNRITNVQNPTGS